MNNQHLYILMLSIHGLVRSENIELGRDADTGGQIKYVIELIKALSHKEDIALIELSLENHRCRSRSYICRRFGKNK